MSEILDTFVEWEQMTELQTLGKRQKVFDEWLGKMKAMIKRGETGGNFQVLLIALGGHASYDTHLASLVTTEGLATFIPSIYRGDLSDEEILSRAQHHVAGLMIQDADAAQDALSAATAGQDLGNDLVTRTRTPAVTPAVTPARTPAVTPARPPPRNAPQTHASTSGPVLSSDSMTQLRQRVPVRNALRPLLVPPRSQREVEERLQSILDSMEEPPTNRYKRTARVSRLWDDLLDDFSALSWAQIGCEPLGSLTSASLRTFPWKTTGPSLFKAGYMILGWPHLVPLPTKLGQGDKGIRAMSASQQAALGSAIKFSLNEVFEKREPFVLHYRSEGFISSKQHQATGNVEPDPSLTVATRSAAETFGKTHLGIIGHVKTHDSTISYRFPSSSGSPSPPPIIPSSPDLAHQNQPGPSNPYLALPPPEDEIPDLDELPSEQPPSPPPHTSAPTMSGHHRITLAANPPYFDGDKSKYLGFVDACTTYIGAYRSEFSQDETKILFVLSYLRNENGTSCAASRWAMNWKQHNFEGFQGLKAGVTSKNFLEEFQRAFGDSNAEQVAAARLMALRQNKRSFADYISDFEMLAADAGYNVVDTTDDKGEYKKGDQDNILIEFLERGLSSEIASRLYNTGVPLPKAYGAFKAWCINIEANALRDQLRKASYGHPTQRPPPQFRPQTAPVAPTPAPARPAANEPVPMEIDRTHARGRNIICYNCQQPGHIARNCPEPRKKRTFFNWATMLEEIENGDKDNEFLKEIAEKLREKGF
ncbi:unnamed protein product [Mycena citricolor]|uniref:CCHC-type domain-containing protein n=1 Tax=Mycena citricolor TaxID=2018698 RepID=A0AAD2HNM2_9AGAR|nr:unnamed protein product [Mycena citricolor]